MPVVRPVIRRLLGAILPALFLLLGDCPSSMALAQVPPASKTDKDAAADKTRLFHNEAEHPLDPLEPEEIRRAVDVVRREKKLAASFRFVIVTLNEPPKGSILHPTVGTALPREAFMVLLDSSTGLGYEVVVNLAQQSVTRFEALPRGVQPSIVLDEFVECEQAARKSPEFQAALKKRGINDLSLVMIDAWSAGHYGNEPKEDRGKRLVRALLGEVRPE